MHVKHYHEQHWFKLWVTESYSIRQLCELSGHSKNKLERIKDYWLDRKPPDPSVSVRHRYFLFDGTYFHKQGCFLVMIDTQEQHIVMNHYVDKESYPCVSPLLVALKKKSLEPRAVTVDGHPHVIRAFTDTWPGITIQRCLYHIQREGMRWLRSYPKTQAGRELRLLLNTVTRIKSVKERDVFLSIFDRWQKRYGDFVQSLPRTSKAFKDLKRTVALINNARDNMFHYLSDSKIRSTTNLLEGFYSRLKSDFQRHRGLSEQHKISYLNWYCYFENN